MRRIPRTFHRNNLAVFIAIAIATSPVQAAGEAIVQEASTTNVAGVAAVEQDIADDRFVFQALQQQWSRDSSTDWLARAPDTEQKLWLTNLWAVSEGRRKLQDFLQDPKQVIRTSLLHALRQQGIEGDPDDYLVTLDRTIEVGDIRIPVTFHGSLVDACLSTDAGADFATATLRQGEEVVPEANKRVILGLLSQSSCRVSMAERLDRFKTERPSLESGYASVLEAQLRKGVLEAKLKGHITGGRDAWIQGLDIVRKAMNDAAEIEVGTLTLSTGPGGVSIPLPQWLVFVRRDAQGREDGVTLYRPGMDQSMLGGRQELFQYLDIRRLGQAVASECSSTPSSGPAGTFGHAVLEAAGPEQEAAAQKFLDDICRKPTSWGNNLQFKPYAGHRFEDNMRAWTQGKVDLMLRDLERLASLPDLPVMAARYQAVADKNRKFNEQHVPTLREFTGRNERDKLTAFFRKEKLIGDDETFDPDAISIDFNGRNMTWTDWVLEGYRNHGDNVIAESNNFMRDATLTSSDPRIAARLNAADVKQSVMMNLRSTYAGDDYVKAVGALLDPDDPRRKTSQDLRVATQILGMQLAVAVEHGKGNIDGNEYRWLKAALDALPGSTAGSDVEIAGFELGGRRIPGIWVVSRKWRAGPGETRPLRESFVFVPEAPYEQAVYREGPRFQSLLKTYAFKQYLVDRALTRDRQVIADAVRNPYSAEFRVSLRPVTDFRTGCDEWLRDQLSDADEATTSRAEVIREQVIKGARFANIGICTAATGGAGVALCAIGTAALVGVDASSAVENLRRGHKDEALWDVAFLWADALDIGQGLKALNPKSLLKLVGKSHFSSVDEAKDAIETVAHQRKGFHQDGGVNDGFSIPGVTFEQLTPMHGRPGNATSGTFYQFGGRTYITEQGRVYEVYFDDAWSTVRLRDPDRPHMPGAPIAYRQGRWQRDEGFLRGDGKNWSKPFKSSEPDEVRLIAADSRPFSPDGRPSTPSAIPSTAGALPSTPPKFDYEVPESHRTFLYDQASRGSRGLDSHYLVTSMSQSESGMIHNFFDLRRQLSSRAEAELSLPLTRHRPLMPSMEPNVTQSAMIDAFYRSADGLVIGEAHHFVASKQFVIENMALLKEKGVRTVYLEHLLHDIHQPDLDAYFRSPAGIPMPERLKAYLDRLDKGHGTDPEKTYTFLRVVEAAKEHELRPVAIDVMASYHVKGMRDEDRARQVMMNFQAQQIIDAYQAQAPGTKWIALVGNSHANAREGIPGVAELTGGIGVRVTDIPDGGTQSIRMDPGGPLGGPGRGGRETFVKSDFLLEVPVDASHSRRFLLDVFDDARPVVRVLPKEARNLHYIGDFAIVKGDRADDPVLYHRSNDRKVRETRIRKDALGFYILRPKWPEVSGQRYATLDDLADALVKLKGMTNRTQADTLFP